MIRYGIGWDPRTVNGSDNVYWWTSVNAEVSDAAQSCPHIRLTVWAVPALPRFQSLPHSVSGGKFARACGAETLALL